MTLVNPEVRRAETQIDEYVKALPAWLSSRSDMVQGILEVYCNSMQFASAMLPAGAVLGGLAESLPMALALEQEQNAGVLQALKWALLLCPDQGAAPPAEEEVLEIIQIGSAYQGLVDVLRQAKHGFVSIEVADANRIVVSEGGDLTGFDARLFSSQQRRRPFLHHTSLTEDEDQLTSEWSAGDFRRFGLLVVDAATEFESELMFGDRVIGVVPTVFRLPQPRHAAQAAVLRDMSLSQQRLLEAGEWGFTSWLDTPFVTLSGETWGVTTVAKTVFAGAGDDYMLRLASFADPKQYTRVNELRAQRMAERCAEELRAAGWVVAVGRRLKDPDAEIDIDAASTEGRHIILELKSTLRPEAPSEVRNRNADLRRGLQQIEVLRKRLGQDVLGFVLTDGYEGDYTTTAAAIRSGVPILTLDQLAGLGADPLGLHSRFQQIREECVPGSNPVEDREIHIGDWTILLRDQEQDRGLR